MAVATGKQWSDFFAKNIHLPPAFDREHAAHDISTPFCIGLNFIEGVTAGSEGVKQAEFQICVSLYDLAYRQFFGRQWLGPHMMTVGGGSTKPKLKYGQNAYFHTSINNVNIVAVIEIVSILDDGNGKEKRVSAGWGIVRIFSMGDEIPDTTRSAKVPVQNVQMYYGSPRALYYMDEPIEDNPLLKQIPDCMLHYTLSSHKAMLRVMNLLPENVIVGGNDIIPGLLDGGDPGKDQLKKPKLLRHIPLEIEGLQINLHPNVEKFEEELCQLLHEDRVSRENRQISGSSVSIVERRLLVGVHNGWCYLEKPVVLHLDVQGESSRSLKPTASPSFRRSSKFILSQKNLLDPGTNGTNGSSGSFLFLKSKIDLQELLEDPMFSVVFTLEYVIGEPMSDEDRKQSKTISRGYTRTVTIRWGAWNPFFQPTSNIVSMALHGGPKPAPDDEFVFKMPDTKMQESVSSKTAGGLVTFNWSYQMKDGMIMSYAASQHTQLKLPGSMMSMQSEGDEDLIESPTSAKKPPSGRSHMAGLYGPQSSIHMQPSASSDIMVSRRPSHAYPSEVMSPGPMSLQVPHQQHMVSQQMLAQQQAPMVQQSLAQPQYGPGAVQLPYPGQQLYVPGQQGPVGMYAMEVSHIRSMGANLQMSMNTAELNELAYTPVHAPIPVGPQPRRGQGLSRAAYAKLYSVGFPPLLDRHGEPPEVIDPQTSVVVSLHKEEQDPLQCNEIVFQFLAFSRLDLAGKPVTSGTVFFTLQFYRCPQLTTERLMLTKPQNEFSSDPAMMPYILQQLDKNGSPENGSPGLEVRYYMDPSFMKPGENGMFLHHLSQQVLHIDVWDGDSLLPIGECAVELKYLCRGGHEAVQTTFELDVITLEYHDDMSIVNSSSQPGSVQPIGVTTINRGKLHIRMGNVGHLVDPKLMLNAPFSLPSKQKLVVSQTAGNSTYPGGSLAAKPFSSSGGLVQKKKVAKAHHLADNNREVAALLFSNKDQIIPEKDTTSATESEKNRKLARIQAVRQKEGMENKFNTLLSNKTALGERQRDYKTLEIYRLQTKKDGIMTMLSETITTEHVIHPSFATSEFFEFVLKNPFNVQHTVTIEWEDNDLKVVTDTREWRHFKQLNQLQTPVEEGMFNKKAESHLPEIFLRPKETVNIPFKYLTFTADQSVQPQGPVDPFKKPEKEKEKKLDSLQEKMIKIFFKNEDGKPIAVLLLKVQPQPHIIDQTFRFHHPEQSFLKKSMRMPVFQSLPGAPVGGTGLAQAHIRCSDVNVICDSKPKQQGEPIDVNLKVALGPSPQIKRFFLAVYLDPFFSRPVQIWQFYVHALQRVDVNCTEGQTSRFSLLLRGTQASRLVRCFSSHPLEMQLHPSNQFMLAAGAVHELNVAVRPMKEGNKFFYLNVVDAEYHQLIRTWLVCVSCHAPVISRAFELALPIGGGKGSSKRITYTNPYPHKKMFSVLTNRDDLLQFKETKFEIEGGATHTIGLRFTPVLKMGTAEVLVFINDEDDKNEETFKIAATYQ